MNRLQRLHAEFDQSPWIDSIDRKLIDSGQLDTLIEDGVRGLTSNPTIFAKAVAAGYYDDLIAERVRQGASNEAIYEAIALKDVGDAADKLRRIYDESRGADGFASLEVEPDLADDSAATLVRARELFRRLSRPNVFVKIPATRAGLPAIEAAIAEGININVTLMFSVDVYRDVAAAYVSGLRKRLARGDDVRNVSSVASFFVSRVDTKVDKMLDALGTPGARELRGRAAIANAKLAYQAFGEIFHGPEFVPLRAAGARVQRCLWASTSTKDPTYRDVRYVEELIGPETVNTMPLETLHAFQEHGELRQALTTGSDPLEPRRLMDSLAVLGIGIDRVTQELIDEGVASFAKSFTQLLDTIEEKRRAGAAPSADDPA